MPGTVAESVAAVKAESLPGLASLYRRAQTSS